MARDLHDLVIQRLFADGLILQTTSARAADRPDISERVRRIIDDLDSAIKVIRSTVFAPQERRREDGTGLRAPARRGDKATESLGVTPALRMTGPLDTAVPHERRRMWHRPATPGLRTRRHGHPRPERSQRHCPGLLCAASGFLRASRHAAPGRLLLGRAGAALPGDTVSQAGVASWPS
ncbi:histidine kinase [Streptomyces sp. NPDC058298]|uniref:histidine kinase n=1 Tax=Streptomyces sp. NPDC058298 TaxID=3346434 RepID=UPI0036EB27D9